MTGEFSKYTITIKDILGAEVIKQGLLSHGPFAQPRMEFFCHYIGSADNRTIAEKVADSDSGHLFIGKAIDDRDWVLNRKIAIISERIGLWRKWEGGRPLV